MLFKVILQFLKELIYLKMDKDRSQNQTIQKLCMNRKQQNFQFLKQWDTQRAQTLMIHRKIIDEFDQSIQLKLTQSSSYIDVVRQFLTDLLTQKIKYELQVVNNPESKIKNNLAGKGIYKNSAKSLGRLHQITNNYKGYKKLKSILENSLSKMEVLLIQSQKQIMQMKTKIQLTINEIQNSNQATLQLCNTIMGVYKDQKNMKPHLCQKDIFILQQQFVYQAYGQTQIQRELGVGVIKFVEYVEELEKKKLVLIKEVIGSYLEGIKQDHEDAMQLSILQDILKKQTQNKYIEECYSSDEFFSKDILGQISTVLSVHEKQIDLKFIKHFLSKLEYNFFFNISYLVLKEYRIFVKLGEELEEITLVLTVDGFLNFYFSKKSISISNNYQEFLLQNVQYSAKIDSSLNMKRNGDINLQVDSKKCTKNSEELQNVKTIVLVFSNQDQRQEFLQFIQRILN